MCIKFIHSFRPFLKHPFKSSTTQRLSRLQHGYCIGVSRRSAQATASKELAQGPYMAARAGGEPATLQLKAIDSTKAPPCPIIIISQKKSRVPYRPTSADFALAFAMHFWIIGPNMNGVTCS